MRTILITLLPLFLPSPSLVAQSSPSLVDHVTDGFIGLSLVQDRRGFIWCGTNTGLLRYDGYAAEFLRHDETLPHTISHDQVNALALAPDGDLWIGTPAGLDRLNPETRRCRHFPELAAPDAPGPGPYVTSLLVDSSGGLWIGTQEDGLLEVSFAMRNGHDTLRVRRHTRCPQDSATLSHNHIHALQYDVEGNGGFLLVGTSSGLCRLNKATGSAERYNRNDADPMSLPHDEVWHILVDGEKNVWLATGAGVCRVLRDPSGRLAFKRLPGDAGGPVFTIARDLQGRLWYGTHRSEIIRCEITTGTVQRQSLEKQFYGRRYGNPVYASLCDQLGGVWFAVHYGLERYDPFRKPFEFVPIDPPPGRWILESGAFCEDRHGDLWIATTARGLFRHERKTGRLVNYTHQPDNPGSIASDEVTALHCDRGGQVWLGTVQGLDRYDPRTDSFVHVYSGVHNSSASRTLPGRCVYALLEDRSNNLWIATNGGLARVEGATGQLTTYLTGSEIHELGFYIGAILQPSRWSDGSLLLAARGLYRFFPSTGTLDRVCSGGTDSAQCIDQLVFSLCEDRSGNIWASTFAGLFCLRTNGTLQRLTTPDPLPSPLACQVIEDRSGALWVSTADRGLIRHDPRRGIWTAFSVQVGFLKNAFFVRGAFRGHDGTVYFGAANGYLRFQPDQIRENPHPPAVRITRVLVFDRPLLHDDPPESVPQIVLTHKENMVTFDYVGLSYGESGNVRYAYQLEGLSDDWLMCGSRRSAVFTNLDPGQYVFRVKACNSDGVWNTPGASMRLVITPPFWQSWWFRMVGLMVLAIALAGGYRYRVQKILAVERLRLRIANDLHDDIGSELSGIALESDMLAKHLEEPDQKRLLNIGRTIRHAADNLRDVVWIISPDQDSIDDLVERMRELTATMLDGLPYEFRAEGGNLRVKPGMEFKRHLLLMFKEMLNNIRRHANASRADIELTFTDGHLCLRVRDNGVGFDTSAHHSGRGLRSMRNRATSIKATLIVKSAPGCGTAVCVDADMPRL